MEVVNPPTLKGANKVISGTHAWEGKVASLRSRYEEVISDKMKLAILIGVLDKEFSEPLMQNGCRPNLGKLEHAASRDFVIGLANHKSQLLKPVPMDTAHLTYPGPGKGVNPDMRWPRFMAKWLPWVRRMHRNVRGRRQRQRRKRG